MRTIRKPHNLVLIRWNDGTVSQSILMDKPVAERHARRMRALPAVAEGTYLGSTAFLIGTVVFAVKMSPWAIEVTLPRWLVKTLTVCARAADRTADALEHVGEPIGNGLKALFVIACTVSGYLLCAFGVYAVFSTGPVVGLLALILVVLLFILASMKGDRP